MSIVQMMQYYYMKIFFLMGKRSSPPVPNTNRQWWVHITNGWRTHHRRFMNQRWWPRYHHRLKSNGTQNRWWCTFRTGGDRGGWVSWSIHHPTSHLVLYHIIEIASHLHAKETKPLLMSAVVPIKMRFLEYWQNIQLFVFLCIYFGSQSQDQRFS